MNADNTIVVFENKNGEHCLHYIEEDDHWTVINYNEKAISFIHSLLVKIGVGTRRGRLALSFDGQLAHGHSFADSVFRSEPLTTGNITLENGGQLPFLI